MKDFLKANVKESHKAIKPFGMMIKGFLRRALFEKVQHTGDCGLTGRFDRNRANLPLKGN